MSVQGFQGARVISSCACCEMREYRLSEQDAFCFAVCESDLILRPVNPNLTDSQMHAGSHSVGDKNTTTVASSGKRSEGAAAGRLDFVCRILADTVTDILDQCGFLVDKVAACTDILLGGGWKPEVFLSAAFGDSLLDLQPSECTCLICMPEAHTPSKLRNVLARMILLTLVTPSLGPSGVLSALLLASLGGLVLGKEGENNKRADYADHGDLLPVAAVTCATVIIAVRAFV
jgi:hypothetical protein